MSRQRFSAEQIIHKLREADVELATTRAPRAAGKRTEKGKPRKRGRGA